MVAHVKDHPRSVQITNNNVWFLYDIGTESAMKSSHGILQGDNATL